jgi:sugar phosphate permease
METTAIDREIAAPEKEHAIGSQPYTLAGPQAAGRWTGFQNFIGNLAGVVAPALTGFVVGRTGHFYWAFAILLAVTIMGTLSWVCLVGPVEQVAWHKKVQGRAAAG